MSAKFVFCVVQFPEITKLQITLFQKLCKEKIDFVILDDSKEESHREGFKQVAKDFNCEYFPHPWSRQVTNDASKRHGEGIRHAFYSMKRDATYEYYGIIDSDILVLNSLCLQTIFQESNLLMHEQLRDQIRYPWPGLCIWKTELHLENAKWDPIKIGRTATDSGGAVYFHMQSIQQLVKEKQLFSYDTLSVEDRVLQLLQNTKGYEFAMQTKELSKKFDKPFWIDAFKVDETIFLHLRDISNWQNAKHEFVQRKIEIALEIFKE